MMRQRGALGLLAATISLAGCSMSTLWWVQRGLRDAGFTKPEARCVARGVRGNLSDEQLWTVRRAVAGLSPPSDGREVEGLLARVEPELALEVHHVLAHYVAQCRAGGADGWADWPAEPSDKGDTGKRIGLPIRPTINEGRSVFG